MQRRTILLAIGATAIVAGLWDFVWRPLTERRSALRAEVTQAQQLHGWVQANIAAAKRGPGQLRADGGLAQASQAIQRSARRFEMAGSVSRIEPREQRVNITLENAPFDRMVIWLAALQSEFGLHIESLAVSRTRPGIVAGQIIIASAPP
ncbi:MAG: hypothetical protein GKR94_12525 [Gammaproteobacteria bacterium]|nr:hypothetical protein [Gammaproteobacteria bacterium]